MVHPWARTEVIKLFNPNVSERSVRYEALAACEAYRADIPTPLVSDVVEHEGRWGIVFERIDGRPLWEIARRRPWLLAGKMMRQFAELHAFIHARESSRLRSQDVFMRRMILNAPSLTPGRKDGYLKVLHGTKSSNPNAMCHNDFHLGNVICTKRGLVVVDWARAARGSPMVDAATTVFKLGRAIRYAGQGVVQHWAASRIGSWLAHTYKRHYVEIERPTPDALRRLAPLVAAAYKREHVIALGELAATMRAVYGNGNVSALKKWVTETIDRGDTSEEHVNKHAFNMLRRRYPEVSLEYGERALLINPENKKLADRLERVRSKV